ncbi:peptidase S8/S53 domain-containing protein [Boletus edulis BED1]|uniref:Peptidase S8/S53 domain-containing protein n=1 Tax=Boletus edulis BED1 TaxID=1328754 RepID=A0AAD4C3G7_BOLED|nr:peptidase S8/S53 domain-containing protein [Boletus edulis BED1]
MPRRHPLIVALVLLVPFVVIVAAAHSVPAKLDHVTFDYFFLDHNPAPSAPSVADCISELGLGLELVGQVGELPNAWLLRAPKHTHPHVLARYNAIRTQAAIQPHTGHALTAINLLEHQLPRQRTKRAPPPIPPDTSAAAIGARLGFTDPLFTQQWHIVNEEFPQHMMNVTGLWEIGITGQGVVTSLVDDGLDYESKDLADNFDAEHSYDFNDHTPLPKPVLADDRHGTRCAGQIAAAKNDVCGVGLAYEAKVAGVRILSGPITDVDEASALNYGFHDVDIYSCSWGPPDDGKSMEGPTYIIHKAFLNGVQNGRRGKGSIFVFASGNGALSGDQCNFDGYTNSIYSVTVSAVDYKGLHPYYSEPCAANLVVAYSSGSGKSIVTTDVGENACSSSHGGTSAAAPNAAGVFALALQVRPDLTWRDIQYLCVQSAQMINPEDPDWEKTASGRPFSYKYGYGQLNAYAFVTAAQDWELVKPQAWFHPSSIQLNNGSLSDPEGTMTGGVPIPPGGINSTFTLTNDKLVEHNFERLEHVTITVWISHSKRGDVEVELVSPNGIKSILAAARKSDLATSGFEGWRFMTVKHWGENPVGDWTIRVSDQSDPEHNGTFHGWRLMFWGSTIDPAQAKTYVLPTNDAILPSPEESESVEVPTSSSTKTHPKPTSGLPSDHDTAEGEADRPAFPGTSPTPSLTPTPDEGWFSDMSNLLSGSKWFFVAITAVILFAVGIGIFYWRRRARHHAAYSSLAGGDLPMSSVSRGAARPRAKELYDAFGEVSDDDEDADEQTMLHPGRSFNEHQEAGLDFHSEFLNDDDPAPAEPTSRYRDDPKPLEGPASPGSGSGSSWEHASQEPSG